MDGFRELTRVFNPVVLVLVGAVSVTYLLLRKRLITAKKDGKKNYPPSIGCLPIIGSLPYLPNFRKLHHWSLEKSYEIGPVFTFKVGNVSTVLLTTHEVIREAFVQHSTDFAGRIEHFVSPILNPQGKGIVLHPYDDEFKKYHQLSLSVLKKLGFGSNVMETRILVEVERLINNIRSLKGVAFNPKDLSLEAMESIVNSVAFGQPIDSEDEVDRRIMELLHRAPDQFVGHLPLDILPSLRFVPFFRRRLNEMKEMTKELFQLIDKKIERTLALDADDNFVTLFTQNEGDNCDRGQLKVTVRDLLTAGTETTSATILWASVLLANHPHVQERLRKEIDSVVPRDRLPSMADASKMTYVKATILEVMRLKTVVPFGIPHATRCDTEVGGFFIPKNSHVFAVLHAAHMNVNVWGDPQEFRPERFIDDNGRIINKELVISFSIGKRSCLGELMARQQVFLFLTGLVQQFNILPPEGSDKVEYEELFELTLWPESISVRYTPRTDS